MVKKLEEISRKHIRVCLKLYYVSKLTLTYLTMILWHIFFYYWL